MSIFRVIVAGAAVALVGTSAICVLRYPPMPEGLEIPNPPTLSQRLDREASKLLSPFETKVEAEPLPSPTPAGVPVFDFNGDGTTDYSLWHASSTQFSIRPSPTASPTNYTIGSSASVPAPGDFNGDGTTDIGLFSAGQWTIKLSTSGTASTYSFGQAGDVPVVADYDGDGKADLAVWRPSNGYWWYIGSYDWSTHSYQLGALGDIPVVGNFDGDTKADFVVFRQSNGNWYLQQSTAGSNVIHWGQAGDVPVAGDYDGDAKSDPAVFRGSTGSWFVLTSSSSYASYTAYNWGTYGDEPAPGDYDGDGKTDTAIWRATTGDWWVTKSSDATYYSVNLGTGGGFAVPSAYVKQIGGHVTGYDVARVRLNPKNATGGTNYYSQNFSWGRTLVDLPGRSGLNAAFGISYNSLVWLKDADNATIYFDPDAGNVGPGFRFGFPVIEQAYYDSGKSTFCYIMVTPDGGRKEFRQTAVTNVYEAADSSYAQIVAPDTSTPNDLVETLPLIVKTTDGTQMTYEWKGTAFHCKEVKDRNGNFITITNNTDGLMTQVTDTLGRSINIAYDSDYLPTDISQTWKDDNGHGSNVTHHWATFAYTTKTLNLSFSGLTVVGPYVTSTIKVLDKVNYADGSYTKFTYNTFGQVYEIQNYAANNDELNHDLYNIASPGSNLTDCPRFTSTKTYAENFNNGNEVEVTNSAPTSATYSLPDSISGSSKEITTAVTGHPDGLITKTYVGSSGWNEGITIATEDCISSGCTGTDRKRWTWTSWTQDNTSLGYIVNPRLTETRVGDGSNTKRTTIEYHSDTGTGINLPEYVKVFDTDLSTTLKQSYSQYNWASAYISRRIVGLQSEVQISGRDSTGLNLISKVTYAYDEGNLTGTDPVQNVSPVQHDTAYGSSFVTGRGLTTSVTRWNVTFPTSETAAVTTSAKYNTAGSPVAQTNALSHTVKISYADVFNSSPGVSTYAYPTTLTDPDGHSSTIKYRYDIGTNIEATSSAPAGQTYGKTSTRIFDAKGRIEKESIFVNGTEKFWTRHDYPTNGVQTQSYTTLTDTPGSTSGPDSSDEVYSESWFDGSGRVLKSLTEHPGSSGGWTATKTIYDILGRVYARSVPTETDSSYDAAGDDLSRGFIWNYTYYDWKGRPVRSVPSDSNGSDGKDTLISYDGCGCAGGQVTTIQGPSVPRDDTTGNARRTQKIYEDILGRKVKTEVMGWDGSTVYTTTENTFNGRDQIVNTKQTDNTSTASPQPHQDVTMTFDGHGRMATRHYPIEDSGHDTSWAYNADDSISTITDPRGDITAFTYNSRGLTTQIAYTPHSGGIDSPTVNFSYDNLGNRTAMDTDGVSNHTYSYNELSQLTSETVAFDDLSNNLTLWYTYELGGALKSMTDPYGYTVTYTNDKLGRVTSLAGPAFAQHSNGDYANNIKYRAFGDTKEIDYALPSGQTAAIKMDYDNGLRVTHSEATQAGSTTSFLLNANFSYNPDDKLAAKDDALNNGFDRTATYDFAGRLKFNQFGVDSATSKRIYQQTLAYDAFSQMTGRTTTYWDNTDGFSASYTNGRQSDLTYDAAGNSVYNTTDSGFQQSTFDASGRRTGSVERIAIFEEHTSTIKEFGSQQGYDGDGRPVIESKGARNIVGSPPPISYSPFKYQVWSSVTGSSITTVMPDGSKLETSIIAGKTVIAKQNAAGTTSTADDSIAWKTADPVTGTVATYGYTNGDPYTGVEESEPLGQTVSIIDPSPFIAEPTSLSQVRGSAGDPEWQCLDGFKAFYGGFYGMPDVCQRRELYSSGAYPAWWVFEENPNNISNASGSAHASHENLHGLAPENTPTQKSQDTNGASGAISLASLPCSDKDDSDTIRVCTQIEMGETGRIELITVVGSQQDDEFDNKLDAALKAMAGSVGPDDNTLETWLNERLDEYRLASRVWCNPAVIEQMKRAWLLTGNGTKLGGEATFLVNGSRRYPTPLKATTANGYNDDSIRIFPNTIALFHVHPNRSPIWPSTPDNNADENGKGDTGMADDNQIDVYVMHQRGLTVYDHISKETKLLRAGLDWMKPCD